MDNSPPLSASALRTARVEPPRHPLVKATSTAAVFDVVAASQREQPVVTTQLQPDADGTGRWHVEIKVVGGSVAHAEPPSISPKILSRRTLSRSRLDPLPPSMPDDGSRFAKEPRRLPRQEPFLLHHGADLSYAPTTIFPPDGRVAYYDTRYPWGCLCRVQTAQGSGSGVLIGPRHVLTASHVVDWTPGWVTVAVLQQYLTARDTANAVYAYASTRIGPGSISDSDSDEDYAVLVLDKRLGDTYGWFGSRTYDSAWDDETSAWRNLGYPADRGWAGTTPVYQRDFFLNELGADYGSARLIRSDTFDNWPGQSGGPVFGFWDDGPYVVGVVSGQGSDYNYISGGSLLPSLVSRARSDMP
jgi:V8-like Glu-specific endopeptidase